MTEENRYQGKKFDYLTEELLTVWTERWIQAWNRLKARYRLKNINDKRYMRDKK